MGGIPEAQDNLVNRPGGGNPILGAGVDLKTLCTGDFAKAHPSLMKILVVLAYYSVGAIAYTSWLEDWNFGDSIYFTTVTVTTVGYGDYSPTTDGSRVFTIFFILFGLGLVGSVISSFAAEVLDSQAEAMMAKLDDDPDDGEKPYGVKIALSIGLILLCVFVGTIFFMLNEDWTFIAALYWSFVTTTTVGYGDMSLEEQSSRVFSIFYILTSTMIVASALGNFTSVMLEKAQEERRKQLMGQRLSLDMLLQMDEGDGDGKVDAGEFLAAFLISLGSVTKEDTDPILKRFKELDADGSGFLDQDDIKLIVEAEQKKKTAKRASVRTGTPVGDVENNLGDDNNAL